MSASARRVSVVGVVRGDGLAAHAPQGAPGILTPSGDGSRKSVTGADVLPFLSRDERERRRLAFGSLFNGRGVRARIARAWDVSPTIVDRVRDAGPEGLALTNERLAALPPSMRAAVLDALRGPLQMSFDFARGGR